MKSKQKSALLRRGFSAVNHPAFRLALAAGICVLVLGCIVLAQWQAHAAARAGQESPDGIWRSLSAESAGLAATAKSVQGALPPARVFQLNGEPLRELLRRTPLESSAPLVESSVVLTAPKPDGTFARFRLAESPIMEAALAANFPAIKTYLGQGIDDPTATMRCDLTPHGFHASIFSAEGSYFVEPVRSDLRYYRSYFKQDGGQDKDWRCLTDQSEVASPTQQPGAPYVLSGATLRTYRLALAATGEYTAFHGATVAGALAAMVTSMNRVNGVYEREVGVRMILVASNSAIIYTNAATDPYTNNSGSTMLGQNQTNLDSVIGSANYDIGHVFSTGGGGVATLNSVCINGSKARGVTGSSSPAGDNFDIDYVAHEMGHQFGGRHTFNGTTSNCASPNRSSSAAYEPGSATTIMGYAGICGAENVQPHSDAYFHVKSLEEILTFIGGTGGGCALATPTGNNPPAVSAGTSFTIPQGTPFNLTASGSDPDGDALTFCWEQYDLGAAAPPNTDNGNRPIFRTFTGTTNPTRTFPKLSDILNNAQTLGESLPTTTRALNFRVTARDNRAGGGGVRDASITINSRADSGPFLVTAPNTAVNWPADSVQTVTWDVANTSVAPVNCAQVNILLSTNGGATFPITLLSGALNNGSAQVTVPNAPTTQARVKIEAVGNIFFDLSNANFAITPGGGCSFSLNPTAQNFTLLGGINTVNLTATAGCNWVAASNAAWISVTNGVSGAGNGTVSYTVTANVGAARTGTVSIAGQTFTVTQDGVADGGLQFYPLAHPVRLLDTRAGQSGCYTPNSPIAGQTSRTQIARGLCDGLAIPANAQAITGNITTVNSGGGYLTLYPSGAAQPVVANSNYGPNEVLNNVFTVGVGAGDGAFKIFANTTTDVVVDVTGYYAPPGTGGLYFHPLPKPVRLLETRAGETGCNTPGAPLPGNSETTQQARGQCQGVTIPTAAQAIVGNATTVNSIGGAGGGYLTLFPASAPRPLVASSNYLPQQVMNAPFTVGLSPAGEFKIYPLTQTDLVIDVLGYYSAEVVDVNGAGLLFTPLPTPVRLLETRLGQNGCYTPGLPISSIRTQPARGVCGGATIAATALGIVGNATVVSPANGGYLTFWPSTAAQPLAAASNFAPGQTFNRHFIVGLGVADGAFNILPSSTTHLVIDVSGYFAP